MTAIEAWFAHPAPLRAIVVRAICGQVERLDRAATRRSVENTIYRSGMRLTMRLEGHTLDAVPCADRDMIVRAVRGISRRGRKEGAAIYTCFDAAIAAMETM